MLVDRIIAAHWRLRRLGKVEAGIFVWEHYEELAERARQEARSFEWSIADNLGGPEGITDERKHREALSKAEEMKAKQDTETATLGRTFIRDASAANAFSKLSRYETALERSLYKALHELQRLQAARRTETSRRFYSSTLSKHPSDRRAPHSLTLTFLARIRMFRW